MAKTNLSISELKEDVTYDPETGIFVRRRTRPGVKAGSVAGCSSHLGYVKVCVLGKRYYAHRLAWMYIHGTWPEHEIDHINGDPSDNRISNLRPATRLENCQNLVTKKGNLGASWHIQNKKFIAQIQVKGVQVNLGFFDKREDAQAAYLKAKANLHEFQPTPRHLTSPEMQESHDQDID